ncbi:hypothetical protein G6E35_002750 [Salmonella enterica subsp. enterica serovar Virchow]|nr:hypothetical protein [Salmonella enterica subsp. enterica serovar Virchow]
MPYSRCVESRREVGCLPTFSPIELYFATKGLTGVRLSSKMRPHSVIGAAW